jgi:iron complex outermembrane recepter protein
MKRLHGYLRTATSCAAMLVGAQTAAAQPASPPATKLESVTITGTISKFAVPAARTPQANSEIDREQLDALEVQSVQEALRYAPFVNAELSGRTGYDEFLVRGFNQSRYQFKDGLSLDPGYLQQQEPWGLERIDVLRGPASVLYGQLAPGGVVNLVGKRPVNTRIATAGLSVGSFGALSAFADFGGALDADGQWSFRLPVLASRRDDMQDFVQSQRQFAAPSLTWRIAPSIRLTLVTLLQRDKYDRTLGLPLPGTLLPGSGGQLRQSLYIGEPGLAPLDSTQTQWGWELEHRLSSHWQLRQVARSTKFRLEGPIVQAPRPGSTDTSVNRRGFDYDSERRQFVIDNQVEVVFGSGVVKHRLMAGLELQRYRGDDSAELFTLDPIDPYAPAYGSQPQSQGPFFGGQSRLNQRGLYGQYRAEIDTRWIATLGLRRSRSETRSIDALSAASQVQKDSKTTGSAALMYLGSSGWSPYLSHAQSFEPQFGNDPLPGGAVVPPSLGKQIEAGMKWQPIDSALGGTLALFELRQTNIVNGDPNNPGFSIVSGEQRHRGVEIEGRWRATAAVEMRAAWSHLDARIVRSENGDQGQRPVNVPRNAASLLAFVTGAALGLPAIDMNLGIRHVGARRADTVEPVTLPAFTLADAGAAYAQGRWRIRVNVKNLFDKRHYVGAVGRSTAPGDPRTVQVSLRGDF